MTLRLYAARKRWPLNAVQVRLRHAKVHPADCDACENEAPRLDRIDMSITLSGALDAEQRRRLMAIADRCPVHRTLSAPVEMVTTEAL